MDQTPERRKSDVSCRLDKQDELLEELKSMMEEHMAKHSITDPALMELVDLVKGAKLLKQVSLFIASCVGAIWAFFTFAWDHISFK